MAKYKNVSGRTLTLIGIGIIKPDEVFETKQEINNPNFVKVNEQKVEIKEEEKTKTKHKIEQ